MTVCETETVHEDYGKLFEHFDRIAVPSEFCKGVLSRQFPNKEFYIIHAYIPNIPYVFYHIGNILDPRKNFRKILEAFVRLNKPDTKLLVKSTCKEDVTINMDRVEVINGLTTEDDMNVLHSRGHCYVNFSNSEGVGMGAIEAAVRDKPVIATNYGGPSEYLKTPYMIECELQELENDDFLFKKGMVWGKPKFEQLLEFMEDAYSKRLTYMDHSHTKNIMSRENILKEFGIEVVGGKNEKTH
jgi:glycosyltransferase involved in cell wall biosynthesis